jgi:hypothetical protein
MPTMMGPCGSLELNPLVASSGANEDYVSGSRVKSVIGRERPRRSGGPRETCVACVYTVTWSPWVTGVIEESG